MQIPTEIGIPMMSGKAAVLTIFMFESSKVTFEGIGGGGNVGIVKITKHVG